MTTNGWLQLALYLGVLLGLAKPLGGFMARVYEGQPHILARWFAPVERLCYRLMGVKPEEEMDWKRYAAAVVLFSFVGFLFVYGLERLQGALPLNPAGMPAVEAKVAFNTAISFVTNTNWQAYGGEATMSYLTQMAALTVQNFVSAATGMAVLVALSRGISRHESNQLGSFWVGGPNSITCGQNVEMKRPSEVPPVVDMLGSRPVTSRIARIIELDKSPGGVRKGRAPTVH